MNEQADQLFTLAGEIENIKEQLRQKQEQLEQVLLALGVDTYYQDPINNVVYKVYKPSGTFVSYKNLDFKRTNLPGETGGGSSVLSKKEAQEKGFAVK